MFHIEYVRSVPYSVKQMFCLINNINAYSEFVPGCNISKILEHYDNEVIAELNIVVNGVISSLVTHNFFIENKNIGIFLIKGPFKLFYGYWEFFAITDSISKIQYVSFYEFNSMWAGVAFNYVFQRVYKSAIRAFFCRAREIYDV